MCGIAGIVSLDRTTPRPARAEDMVPALHHRGPDHQGFYESPLLSMGMARLSIIDLAGGNQPIANEDETVWVVMNGEIYNFDELRRELLERGHRFRTRSDTESLVHAYEEWGTDCVSHLRGMFAFALWDQRRSRLVLARDRLGEKPLYLARTPSHLAFASELKAFPAALPVDRSVDVEALDEYLSFGYISAPRSIHRGIRKLPPGPLAVVEDGRIEERRYWRPSLEPLAFPSQAAAEEALLPIMRDAVRSQMVSDAPLGAFLSGGIDSSTIVALMTQAGSRTLRTFCVGFEEAGFDERPHARKVAEFLGTEHEDWVLRPRVAEVLPSLVRHFDEPFGDKSLVPTYFVSKMARERVKVVLSGDGGDETFGGYVSYASSLARSERHARRPALAQRAARRLASLYPAGAPRGFAVRKRAFDERHRFVAGSLVFDPDRKRALFTDSLRSALAGTDPLAAKARHLAGTEHLELISALQHADVMHYLPDDILVKVDRMSMLTSLESRAPLLDHRLVEFGLRLPGKFKIAGGVTKKILRDLAGDLLPADILARPKQGFALPVREWLRGELRGLLHDVVLGKPMRESGWFRPDALTRLVDGASRGESSNQLWLLLCLGLWLTR